MEYSSETEVKLCKLETKVDNDSSGVVAKLAKVVIDAELVVVITFEDDKITEEFKLKKLVTVSVEVIDLDVLEYSSETEVKLFKLETKVETDKKGVVANLAAITVEVDTVAVEMIGAELVRIAGVDVIVEEVVSGTELVAAITVEVDTVAVEMIGAELVRIAGVDVIVEEVVSGTELVAAITVEVDTVVFCFSVLFSVVNVGFVVELNIVVIFVVGIEMAVVVAVVAIRIEVVADKLSVVILFVDLVVVVNVVAVFDFIGVSEVVVLVEVVVVVDFVVVVEVVLVMNIVIVVVNVSVGVYVVVFVD